MESSEKAKIKEVQKKRQEKKWKKEKEKGETQKKKLVEKCKEKIVSLFTARMTEEKKEKEGRKRDRRPRWKMALSPFAFGAELAVCQRCSGRTAEKDGDDGKNAAAGSTGEREQMGGGDSTKVEAATKRRRK